ncbi:MAG: N-acetyl-alpha-D-glucosaminyl L-malate synthase BshA, partial [bacterium]
HFISYALPFRLQREFHENIYFHETEQVNYPVLNSNLYTLSLAVKMSQIVQDENLDLIHVHYAVPHAISAFLAKRLISPRRIPVVTTLHGTDITLVGRSPSFFPVVKFGIQESDAVVAVSKWLRAETYEHFQITKEVEVIYNFVDTEEFKPGRSPCRREHFAKADEKILLHISNFRPVKRLEDVVRICGLINARVASRLILVGDGPDRDKAFRLAQELNIADRVRFVGKQESIQPYFSIADLFLFPSEYESFGLAALEAMSCEVPVITSDGGGLPEVLEQGVSGHLCSVGSVECMADYGVELLTNEEKSRAMGAAGRKRAIEHFSADRAVTEYENLYKRLLS